MCRRAGPRERSLQVSTKRVEERRGSRVLDGEGSRLLAVIATIAAVAPRKPVYGSCAAAQRHHSYDVRSAAPAALGQPPQASPNQEAWRPDGRTRKLSTPQKEIRRPLNRSMAVRVSRLRATSSPMCCDAAATCLPLSQHRGGTRPLPLNRLILMRSFETQGVTEAALVGKVRAYSGRHEQPTHEYLSTSGGGSAHGSRVPAGADRGRRPGRHVGANGARCRQRPSAAL